MTGASGGLQAIAIVLVLVGLALSTQAIISSETPQDVVFKELFAVLPLILGVAILKLQKA